MKTALGETQTLRAGCSKAEPKIFAPPQTPSRGAGWPKFNQLEMVTTFTYKPSYRGNRPTNTATNQHTDRADYNTLRRS